MPRLVKVSRLTRGDAQRVREDEPVGNTSRKSVRRSIGDRAGVAECDAELARIAAPA